MKISDRYQISLDGKRISVPAGSNPLFPIIHKGEGNWLRNRDILDYMRQEDILRDPRIYAVNRPGLLEDFKRSLLHLSLEQAALYPTYGQYVKKMWELEGAYPGLAKVVPLGRTKNKRKIYALRVSALTNSEAQNKPAVLFTGLIHAREWATGVVTMKTAEKLLEGYGKDPEMTRRLQSAEIWFVPVINPDGYEHSLSQDSFWRKNREIIYQDETPCPPPDAKHIPVTTGIDLNRNWYDEKHKSLYRTSGDKPCSTLDDYGASDYPEDDDYRGARGASAREVAALERFMQAKKNLVAVIDHHSYGDLILYPWGHTRKHVDNVKEYLDCANAMQKAGNNTFTVMQSVNLYPTTGSSEDYEHVNAIFNFTLEIGSRFHPDQEELNELVVRIPKVDLAFLDWVIQHKNAPRAA